MPTKDSSGQSIPVPFRRIKDGQTILIRIVECNQKLHGAAPTVYSRQPSYVVDTLMVMDHRDDDDDEDDRDDGSDDAVDDGS